MFASERLHWRALLGATLLSVAGGGPAAGCDHCGRPPMATVPAGTAGATRSAARATATSTGPARSLPDGVRPMTVPAGLRRVTVDLEPSGIAWVPALDRYLVVSDDTGLEADDTKHAAWLFAVDRDGTFDEEPVPIVGVAELDDPEAICPGPDGTYFVTTSHSPNRKGRTKPDRRQLLQVKVVARTLEVVGRLDLTAARAADGSAWQAAAGLPAAGRLDLEALAFRDGALYVGLKSPLTASGAAVVMRLADAVTAFHAGRIPDGAFTRFFQVPLAVQAEGREVNQGISGMTFLDDGSLLLLGNAPKGMPDDGGGALWQLAAPGAEGARARLVDRFQTLTPEGISLSAGGDAVVVVFDGGRDQTLWMQRPLPR